MDSARLLVLLSGVVLCYGRRNGNNTAAVITKTKKQLGDECGDVRPSYQFLFNAWRRNMQGQSNRDCDTLFRTGTTASGVNGINIRGTALDVYCEMQWQNHNWINIMRRRSAAQSFAQPWLAYQNGFGDLSSNDFWLGLNAMHQLSFHLRRPVLRVELGGGQNAPYAEYRIFRVANERRRYRLRIGGYRGNAGDGLSYHNGSPFSTMDNDNDHEHFGRSCSVTYGNGGWWFRDFYTSNLTGMFNGNAAARNGITWYFWRSNFNSIQDVVMRLRNG